MIEQGTFDSVNINNYCLVNSSNEVSGIYLDHYSKFIPNMGRLPMAEGRMKLQIHELMNIYGIFFGGESIRHPFKTVTLFTDSAVKVNGGGPTLKTIEVTDFVYLRLTNDGVNTVRERFPERAASRVSGDLTSMQFGTVAYLFGPRLYNGSMVQEIVDNQLLISR